MSLKQTKTLLGKYARKAVHKGVNAIYEPTRRTFGPEGRNALLFRTFNRGSRIANDGVTVAQCQEPKDVFVRLAAEAFKEASLRTNEKVGDGTTLTTILGGYLFNHVYSQVAESDSEIKIGSKKGVGIITLKKRILESAKIVKEEIKKVAKKILSLEDLEKVAIISVEDEGLGKVVAKMAYKVGVDGFIDVVEGYKGEIETEVIEGMRFPAKVSAKAFVNNPQRYEMIAKDCPIFITNYALDNPAQLAKVINPFIENNPKLIVIAPSFSDTCLTEIFKSMFSITPQGQRVKKPNVDIFPVSVPSLRTEQLDDLAVYCGARFIDKGKGHKLESGTIDDLGFLEMLVVKDTEAKEDAVATGGTGTRQTDVVVDKINKTKEKTLVGRRIEMLKGQLENTKEDRFKKLLERRIASMGSSVGIIRVGDTTQASSLHRKLKIEDAVYACKAALRGGYVKGGGLCLREIADELPDDDILKEALIAPYKQIQASVDGGLVIGDEVIDPAEAIYYSVEHATQIIAQLITVEIITPELEDPLMGEGEYEIAKWLREGVIVNKIKEGQLKENEAEGYRDFMGGITSEEMEILDKG